MRPWLALVARFVLGVLFLWSGLTKLTNPPGFLRGVVAYHATPDWLSRGIAYGLPILEICLAVMLILGILTRIVAATALLLQVVFLIGVIQLGARGIKTGTAVFGVGGVSTHATQYLLTALLNVVLIAFGAVLVWWPWTRVSLDELLSRGDYVEAPSSKRLRNEQGRRKYEADVAAAAARAKIRNRYLAIGILLPVVLISFISIGVQAKRAMPAGDVSDNASSRLGVSVGSTATVIVDVFEDFQSTKSLALEKQLGATLDKIAAEPNRQVRYHMVAIYNASSSGNRYSARAANAAICASDINVKEFQLYHRYLFGVDGNGAQIMPAVGSHGRTDTSLITYSQNTLKLASTEQSTFNSCVQSEQHQGMVEATTMNFTNRGYTNVPVVLVNGVRQKTLTVDALNKAVAATAVKNPPKPQPASSASVSPVPASSTAASSPAASASASATPSVSVSASP
jgi:uncharacterized membrane protein YphA (DoxX/SURF4 family)